MRQNDVDGKAPPLWRRGPIGRFGEPRANISALDSDWMELERKRGISITPGSAI